MRRRFNDIKAGLLALAILVAHLLIATSASAQGRAELVVAGGCFWCVEADFEKVEGVIEVVSGYAGGTVANPTYRQVTGGGTGHYEAVRIRFDPAVVSRAQLLHLFLRSIDPTDAGGQFCDRGDSYRTAIFVEGTQDRALAQEAIARAEADLGRAVVTPVLPAGPFWMAEAEHQDYYKGDDFILTRAGPKRQAEAYRFYRDACGRDDRVRALWGDDAPFAG